MSGEIELIREYTEARRKRGKHNSHLEALLARIDVLEAGHLRRTKLCHEHITALQAVEARVERLRVVARKPWDAAALDALHEGDLPDA